MKRALPVLAVLAATLSTPVMADGIFSFLNPSALATDLDLNGEHRGTELPSGAVLSLSAPAHTVHGFGAAPQLRVPEAFAGGVRPALSDNRAEDLLQAMERIADAAGSETTGDLILLDVSPRPSFWQRIFGL